MVTATGTGTGGMVETRTLGIGARGQLKGRGKLAKAAPVQIECKNMGTEPKTAANLWSARMLMTGHAIRGDYPPVETGTKVEIARTRRKTGIGIVGTRRPRVLVGRLLGIRRRARIEEERGIKASGGEATRIGGETPRSGGRGMREVIGPQSMGIHVICRRRVEMSQKVRGLGGRGPR